MPATKTPQAKPPKGGAYKKATASVSPRVLKNLADAAKQIYQPKKHK